MKKIEQFLNSNKYLGLFFLRLFIGLRIIYGVIDNVISWDKMMEFSEFLNTNHFPVATISAITSVYVQFFSALLLLIGYKTQLASFFLILNFIVAILCFHLPINDSIEGMTPALAMLFGCIVFLFNGAGKFSIDSNPN